MKNRILTFIIGILVGAIITTVGFLAYSKSINRNPNEMRMPIGENGQMQRSSDNVEQPPEKPDGNFKPAMQNNI